MSIKQNLMSLLHDEISRLIKERAEHYQNFGFAVHAHGWQHITAEHAKGRINESQSLEKELRTAIRVIEKLNIDDLVICGASTATTEEDSQGQGPRVLSSEKQC